MSHGSPFTKCGGRAALRGRCVNELGKPVLPLRLTLYRVRVDPGQTRGPARLRTIWTRWERVNRPSCREEEGAPPSTNPMGDRRILGVAVTGVSVGVFGLALTTVGYTSTGGTGTAGPWPVFGALVAGLGVVVSAAAAVSIRT